jgi:hypothetical protein
LITWEQLSLKCIREDTDLSEPLEGEEGQQWLFLCQGHGGPWFWTFFLHGNTKLVSGQGQLGQFD